jgi:hypothetical protein
MTRKDFVENLQKELDDRLRQKESKERSDVNRAEAIKKYGPEQWKALQNAVSTAVDQVNKRQPSPLLTFFGKKNWFDLRNKNGFSVQAASGTSVEVRYDPDNANITFKVRYDPGNANMTPRTADRDGEFKARVRENQVCYLDPRAGAISIQHMAQKLLSHTLKEPRGHRRWFFPGQRSA